MLLPHCLCARPMRFSRPTWRGLDTGAVIPAEELPVLFQPFPHIDRAVERKSGVGLGLAISASIVRLMGSEIHVESEVGIGTKLWFELDLPVVDPRGMLSVPPATRVRGPTNTSAASDPPLAPPPAMLTRLHEFAQQGSMTEIMREAARIADFDTRYRRFAIQVQRLAATYQSKAVLHLIKEHLSK